MTKTGIFDGKKSTAASFGRSLASVLAAPLARQHSCVYPTAHPLKEELPKEQIHLRRREAPAFLSPRSVQTHPSITGKPSAVLILPIKQRHGAICHGGAGGRQALDRLLVLPDINRNIELKLPVARVFVL